MAQGVTFTSKVFLGTDATAQSLRSVTGAPSFAAGDQQGDLAVSDNGQIYACDGANWSPLVNADGQTTMTSPLNIQRLTQGAVLIGNAGNSTATVETQLVALEDVTGAGLRAVLGIDSGTTTITSENTAATPLPLNLAIGALQIGGAPGTSGQVLTSAGAGAAPTWASPAAALTALTQDVTATGPGSAAATVVGMGGSATKVLFVIEGGQYATLQAAVNAATANTMILVGPKATGDWGNVSMTTVDKNLIIAAISGAGSNKVVKVGSITYNPTGALDPNLNEVYLYGLYIQGTFAGGSALSLAGTGTARLRAWGCYILNDSVTGTAAVTNSNAAANSSLYIDNCVVSLSASATGSTVVHSGGYTVIRNRCEISASTAGGATGFALNASAGTVEITDSYLSNSRNVAVANVSGVTTFVSAAYSTLYNSSDLAGACCVNIATAGATFGCGDATLSAGTTVGTAAVPLVSVANGVFVYTVVNFGFATNFAAASTTAVLRPASQTVGRKVLADVGTLGTISTGAPTAANLRTAHRFLNTFAGPGNLVLPNLTVNDDGLRIEIANASGANVTVAPTSGVSRQMTIGGGQSWIWRGQAPAAWYCTSNV